METVREKVKHVFTAKQTRLHTCHWPDCEVRVPPALWGCKRHWFMLPKEIRRKIWKEYSSGQEERLDPSREYISAVIEAQNWIKEHYSREYYS